VDKKQLLWIILLSFVIAMFAQRFFAPKAPAPAPSTQPAAAAPPQTGAKNLWSYGGTFLPDKPGEVEAHRLGSLDPDGDYRFQLELDPRGAAVRTAKLTGFYQTVKQKRTKNKTPQQLQDWSYALLTPVVGATAEQTVLPFSTEMLTVDDEAITTFISPRRDGQQVGWMKLDPTEEAPAVDADGTQRIRYRLNLYRAGDRSKPAYTLYKTYTVRPGSYSFRLHLRVENHSGADRKLSVLQYGPTGLPLEDIRTDLRDALVAEYVTAENTIGIPKRGKIQRSKSLEDTTPKALGDNRPGTTDPAIWAGAGNKFFGCLLYPIPDGIDVGKVDDATPTADLWIKPAQYAFGFSTKVVGTTKDDKSQLVTMTADAKTVPDGGALELGFDIFCGPKSHGLFDKTPLYHKLQYRNAVTFRSCNWCLIEPLARAVMWIIEAGGAAIGNYGVIIILMVLCIRLALHPITKRSQVSMMNMKKLQPQMQAIQEKYKNDKEAMQKAMMGVWKETGFSPFLGCLPMFLQMPIWIALWAGLGASVALRHQGLLPFWITDLAGPDTVIAFSQPVNIPLLGALIGPVHGLNLLPLLLTVFMFLQQKLTPMQSAATASPDQQKQQKMMMWMMSIMMLLIFYNAPSGLTLYIMASTGGGVLESYVIRKHIREREQLEAAREVKVSAPGKAARDKRPKKPKDRFRM